MQNYDLKNACYLPINIVGNPVGFQIVDERKEPLIKKRKEKNYIFNYYFLTNGCFFERDKLFNVASYRRLIIYSVLNLAPKLSMKSS